MNIHWFFKFKKGDYKNYIKDFSLDSRSLKICIIFELIKFKVAIDFFAKFVVDSHE